jgi:hypothetical protein
MRKILRKPSTPSISILLHPNARVYSESTCSTRRKSSKNSATYSSLRSTAWAFVLVPWMKWTDATYAEENNTLPNWYAKRCKPSNSGFRRVQGRLPSCPETSHLEKPSPWFRRAQPGAASSRGRIASRSKILWPSESEGRRYKWPRSPDLTVLRFHGKNEEWLKKLSTAGRMIRS